MEKRIMVGIPVNRDLSPKFVISLLKVTNYLHASEGFTVDINFNDGTMLSAQRNKIMREAVQARMNLLFIDSDMIFDEHTIESVLRYSDKGDLIGGLCYMRRAPFKPAVFAEDKVLTENCFTGIKQSNIPVYPFKVAAVGTAFLLIKYDVMVQILQRYKHPFNHITMPNYDQIGEDLSFMHRCNKMGLKIICVPNVDIGHMTFSTIGRKQHMSALQKIEQAKQAKVERNTQNADH